MILERARVVRCEDGRVWVSSESQSGCRRCAEGRGCGGGVFARLLGDRLRYIRIDSNETFAPGDIVMIGLDERALLAGAFLAYLVPVIGLLLGALLTSRIATGDAAVMLGAGVGFTLALLWLRRHAARHAADPRFEPRIVQRLAPDERCPHDTDIGSQPS